MAKKKKEIEDLGNITRIFNETKPASHDKPTLIFFIVMLVGLFMLGVVLIFFTGCGPSKYLPPKGFRGGTLKVSHPDKVYNLI